MLVKGGPGVVGCALLVLDVIICSAITHLPRCFHPRTFVKNIELNILLSDSFISKLYFHLGYSTGEFATHCPWFVNLIS